MRLLIKQKVFSWADKFLVKDEYGGDRYNVQGEIFSLGHRLHIYDYSGREVALIQQKLFSFKPRYFIFINGVQVAELVKQFTMFKQKYIVEGQEWSLEGDFWSHDYRLMKDDGSVIMSVKKNGLRGAIAMPSIFKMT